MINPGYRVQVLASMNGGSLLSYTRRLWHARTAGSARRRHQAWVACSVVVVATLTCAGVLVSGIAPASAASANKSPIAVGLLVDVNSATLSFPFIPPAANVAAKAINAAGGINGHPVKVDFCDGQTNPSVTQECVQTLVNQDHVVALVGGINIESTVYPTLDAAGVANFGEVPATQGDLTDSLSFPLVGGVASEPNLVGLVPKGVTRVALVRAQTSAGALGVQIDTPAFAAKGITLVDVPFAANTVDFSPILAQVKSLNVGAIALEESATVNTQIITTAAQLGMNLPFMILDKLSEQTLSQISGSKQNVKIALDWGTNSKLYPGIKQYNAEMAKYGQGVYDKVNSDTVNTWLAVHLFAQIASKLPSVTPATFKAAVEKEKSLVTGLTPPINFTHAPLTQYPRIFRITSLPGEVANKKLTQTSNTWYTGWPPSTQAG
jgi:branched-chain amino acid transport system substrate-binding protein